MEEMDLSGLHIHYFAVCERKLWLYDRGITMEQEHDRILEGKVLHESSYKNSENKEILIDNAFKLDAITGEHVREVKISSRMTDADRLQMLFYLYQLELRGLNKKGLVSYTLEKKTEEIELDEQKRERVKEAISRSKEILAEEMPPLPVKKKYCSKCAYYEFCFIAEEEES